jgi:hypothetical protein
MAVTPDRAATRSGGKTACAMCGRRYDPTAHAACAGCPMNLGCALACCPHCGFSSADPARSVLVRAFERLRRS